LEEQKLIELTVDIVAAHVGNNHVAVGDVAGLVQQVHGALAKLGAAPATPEPETKAAVSIRASVKPDYLVCMECGRKQTTLKRHLASAHRKTPEQYRSDHGLSRDYPMVAPNYSARRSALANANGLGRRGRSEARASEPSAAKASEGAEEPS
jgi:predicted transcriptional regulator